MPNVGNKKYGYKPEQVAKARSESIKTKEPMRGPDINVQQPNRAQNNDPNKNAVNNFMNREAVSNLNSPVAPTRDIARLQTGLNQMTKGRMEPLKVDGVYGPKTQSVAQRVMPDRGMKKDVSNRGSALNHRKIAPNSNTGARRHAGSKASTPVAQNTPMGRSVKKAGKY